MVEHVTGMILNMPVFQFSLEGSLVRLLMSSRGFAETAVGLAIFMTCFLAGQLLMHMPLQVTGRDGTVRCTPRVTSALSFPEAAVPLAAEATAALDHLGDILALSTSSAHHIPA